LQLFFGRFLEILAHSDLLVDIAVYEVFKPNIAREVEVEAVALLACAERAAR